MHRRILFVFRQDLRALDNTGLRNATRDGKEIIPLFVIDTTIISSFHSDDTRLWFLVEALQLLETNLRSLWSWLLVRTWNPVEIIPDIVKTYACDALYYNRSYGTNSLTRDQTLQQRCRENSIAHRDFADFLLVEPEAVPARKVFTPFYHLRQQVPKRLWSNEIHHISSLSLPPIDRSAIQNNFSWKSSTRSALAANTTLTTFDYSSYADTRNIPSLANGTSRLSPYTRFGLLSIRHILRHVLTSTVPEQNRNQHGIVKNSEESTVTFDKKQFSNVFVSELARREFRHHIAVQFPYSRQLEFQEKRRGIQRQNNEIRFEARKNGTTGYPIVDAGMRQLKTENRMHNRVRMIVASFLTKDLLIDRRRGEQHFADYLLDYDENVNIGNWQRAASVGADPKPLRIFNPILQSQRFDPQAAYILKRIPELQGQPLEAIHDPLTHRLSYYPPIVNHYITSKQAKLLYTP